MQTSVIFVFLSIGLLGLSETGPEPVSANRQDILPLSPSAIMHPDSPKSPITQNSQAGRSSTNLPSDIRYTIDRPEQSVWRNSADQRPIHSAARQTTTLSYGEHKRQKVDIYQALAANASDQSTAKPPLVVFVHGGGWWFGSRNRVQEKPAWLTANGIVFASAGYRLLPDGNVEDQARDIASAIRILAQNTDRLGYDADNIILMGHSAGAHLAALVATDPSYAGRTMQRIKGVILLDGAGYDVPLRISGADRRSRRLFLRTFSRQPRRQALLSPVNHTTRPNAPHWLLLHVADRQESKIQAQRLGKRLNAAGSKATITAISGTDHSGLNRKLGSAGFSANDAVLNFIKSLK